MRRLRNGLACLTLALACWVLVEGALLFREARATAQEARQDISEASYLVNENLLYLRGTMTELREASSEWAQASKEQRRYLRHTTVRVNRILEDTSAIVAQANILVQGLNQNLNANLLPEATNDLRLLGETLATLRDTGEALKALAADPKNEQVREEAIALLAQAQALTAQGEKTLAEFEKVAAETKKVPPVARKALWIQIIVALLTAARP